MAAANTSGGGSASRDAKQKKSGGSSTSATASTSRTSATASTRATSGGKFTLTELFGEEEDATTIAEAKVNLLKSVLWRRVAGGLLKRSEDLEGNLFVELRVYNKADIINVKAHQRYWKAAVNLRYQVDDSAPELDALHTFIKLAKAKFTHEGTFQLDNVKYE